MLKSFKSNKPKKITTIDISKPTSSIPETQLKNLNTISIQEAQTLQRQQSDTGESFVQKHYDALINNSNRNSSSDRVISHASNKKSFVDRVTSVQSSNSFNSSSSSNPNSNSHLYGVVLYDFEAERPDELSCKAGENIIIFAHHDQEWFIAKTIDRIGGPGFVPCGFVMVVDLKTGYSSSNPLSNDIESVNLPTVVEWKQNIEQQKNKNIDLKKQRNSSSQQVRSQSIVNSHSSLNNSFQQPPNTSQQHNSRSYSINSKHSSQKNLSSRHQSLNTDENFILEAKVTEYIWEDQKYKFILNCLTSFSKTTTLKRTYEDFYNLQINILENYPEESGKVILKDGNMSQRIVPYIPGPVPYVTEDITKKRLLDLNTYINELIHLPNKISRSDVVLNLFKPLNNGFDNEKELESSHLRSISQSQNQSAESMKFKQDVFQQQEISQPDAIKDNDFVQENIDSADEYKIDPIFTESNHGTLGVEEDGTLNMQDLNINDETFQQNGKHAKHSSNLSHHSKGLGFSTQPFINKRQSIDTEKTPKNPALTINTHQVMDQSQSNNTITDLLNTPMTATPSSAKSVKIKFYYDDDIFALLVNSNITIQEIEPKIIKKIAIDNFSLYVKGSAMKEKITTDQELQQAISTKQKISVVSE